MENYADVMRRVASNKNVRGVAPFVLGQVLVETEPADTNTQESLTAAPWVRGVDVNTESSVSVLPSKIIAGSFDLHGRSVIVGIDFAQSMNLSVGDRLFHFLAERLEKNEGTLRQAGRGSHFAGRLHCDRYFRCGLL